MRSLKAGLLAVAASASLAAALPTTATAATPRAGQYCKNADIGKTATYKGRRVKCVREGSHARWRYR
ncbi:MAG: hypothetical protein KDC33_04315 [Thermoleophilia bacterium]|nr:hypothetical protein [Thermoleophilia bacterium]